MRHERALAWVLAAAVLAGCGSAPSRSSPRGEDAVKRTNAAEINVSLAQAYLQQGKLDVAREKLEKAHALDPNLPSAHTLSAVLAERVGQTERAADFYRRAAELAPQSGDTNNNYGTFLCRRGRYAEADEYFQRAVADPYYTTPAVGWANRGACALKWERAELAEDALRRALRYDPGMPEPLYLMADILYKKGDHFRARAFVQRFEGAGQARPEALWLAMRIEEALDNPRAARDYRRRLLAEFPESDQAQSLTDDRSGR